MEAVVMGNVTLDVLCFWIDDVPRYESIAFERSVVSPGGCGSNVAIGLCALGISTALIGRIGADPAAQLIKDTWDRVGLNYQYVKSEFSLQTAVSIGLVDKYAEPRFIHAPGANALLSVDDLKIADLFNQGTRSLHIAGYFVLPGLLDANLRNPLREARSRGILTTLDVVRSPNMDKPERLWPCMPYLDVFLCNALEAKRLTGEPDHQLAANRLRKLGAESVIVKLGSGGCWVESGSTSQLVPGQIVDAVDTSGAGDAFAAGLISALLKGSDLVSSCHEANKSGARVASEYGCITAWLLS